MSELEPPQSERGEQAIPPAAEMPPPVSPSHAAPPPRKSRSGLFFFGALTGCAIVVGGFVLLAIMAMAMAGDATDVSFAAEKVAVIPIEGEILEARETLDALKRHAGNATVKAIVIRINSPGGAIAPSQEIYAAIRRTRADTKKPIIDRKS